MSPAIRNQQNQLLALLRQAHGAEVPLSEILALKISQFGARLLELRRLGYNIQNRQKIRNGKRLSWYRLLPPIALTTSSTPETSKTLAPETPATDALFEISPESRYPD
jgi:hypothetical protein